MSAPYRIAFKIDFKSIWTGGVSYYENLFSALRAVLSPQDATLLGFIASDQSHYETLLSQLDEVHPLPSSKPAKNESTKFLPRLLAKARRRFLPPPPIEDSLSRAMRECRTDIVYLRGSSGRNFRIPTLSWFPDFQYVHYPEMYSPSEVAHLNGLVKEIAEYSTRVIVSSETAKRDFSQLVPQFAYKARVLYFVSFLKESIYSQSVHDVCNEYNLPERFFHLPNQFWKHKNHHLVLEALTLARRKNPDIFIVSTGLLSDYRNPHYASEFLAEVSHSGNRNNFIFLGLVPRDHMYAIMRQSLCVIQPSLFEGWSTIVEEVKSLGKAILLSDLPVHHEQNPPSAEYFDPFDAHSLATKMLLAYDKYLPGPDLTLEKQARENFHGRVTSFGETLLAIVKEVLDEWPSERQHQGIQ